MKWSVGFVAILLACAGCTPSHISEMSKKTWQAQTVSIPELDHVITWMNPVQPSPPAMSQGELNRRVLFMEADVKESGETPPASALKDLGKFVKDADFQGRLKALESVAFPSAYASPEREEARKKYLDEWKNIEKTLTSGGKLEEVRKSLDKLDLYAQQMKFIPGQTVPTGEEAKKYSAVQDYVDPYKK